MEKGRLLKNKITGKPTRANQNLVLKKEQKWKMRITPCSGKAIDEDYKGRNLNGNQVRRALI